MKSARGPGRQFQTEGRRLVDSVFEQAYVHTLNNACVQRVNVGSPEVSITPTSSKQEEYELLRVLGTRPSSGQRELASSLGVSLGKANYVLRALIDKGFVKAENYRNSKNRLAYFYVLTPKGLTAKAELTKHFLARKVREYEELRLEIERLRLDSVKSVSDG